MIKLMTLMFALIISGCATVHNDNHNVFHVTHEVEQVHYNEFLLHAYDDESIVQQTVSIHKYNLGKWIPSVAHRLYNQDLSSFIEFRISFSDQVTYSSYKYFTKDKEGKYSLQIEESKNINSLDNTFKISIVKDKGAATLYINQVPIMTGPMLHEVKYVGILYVSMDVSFDTIQE